MISRGQRVAAAIAAIVIVVPLACGAAAAPRATGVCDSFLSFLCPKTDPEPEDTEAPDDPKKPDDTGTTDGPATTDDQGGTEPQDEADRDSDVRIPETPTLEEHRTPDDGTAASEDPVPAPLDQEAPIFTATPAAMRSSGLSFTGLKGIAVVSVPTVDGGSVRVLKISADSITISGFSLTVRPPEEPGLVTTADTMSLQGDVSVYLGSITASSMGGEPLTIGIDTPPPLDDVEPGLLDVTMGLVGSTADSISYTNTDQNIVGAG